MEGLEALIQKADDDYLIGLSNKGTVKRAYKDLEQETIKAAWQGEEVQVSLKEETCMLRMPLGESTCSCPSRSICRHIVTAILWMKQEVAKAQEETETKAAGDAEAEPAEIADAAKNVSEERESAALPVLTEILKIPPERLKRACGSKRYGQFLAHMRAGELPPMSESSIVTVTLPWDKVTVKLLEPASYTACSCHSKELCAHKAQAMLAYQLMKKKYTLEELEVSKEPEDGWEKELVKEACESICGEISHQFCTGLSRESKEASESLLRLAVIAHRAGLPAMENRLREAAAYYEQYFSRSAAFRGEELAGKLLMLYLTSSKLLRAKSDEEIRALAGAFRDSYLLVGTLHLVGMGSRSFSSKTGYEGEIYYFLETRKKQWYTWTDARPTFYEGKTVPKRPSYNASAPWELNCSRQQLQSLVFDLQNAKVASGRRLSVSKESQGETIGVRSPDLDEAREMIYWDYEKMVSSCTGQMDAKEAQGSKESLALVGAVNWEEASFDKVQQRFFWNIYDQRGRALSIALNYTKEERLIINLLERLEQRLRKSRPEAIVFLGSFYTDEEGKPCLYPIEFFTGVQPPVSESKEVSEEVRAESSLKLPPEAILKSMEQYFREVQGLLGDLFVTGLYSLQKETLLTCRELGEEGEQMGLHQAGQVFAKVYQLLEGRRHQMDFSPKPVIEALGRVEAYGKICRERLLRDRALSSLQK